MAADPPIMLMDEPFGAIDPIARDRLQDDFLRLHRQVRKTVIFVTHDIDEAIKMGDRIAIMRDGHLVQLDTADELLAAPADDFVASFVGADRGLKRLRVRTLQRPRARPPSPGATHRRSARDQPARRAVDDARRGRQPAQRDRRGGTAGRAASAWRRSRDADGPDGRPALDGPAAEAPARERPLHPVLAAGPGPVIPKFGGGGSQRASSQNEQFCAGWFFDNFSSRFAPRLIEHIELTAIAVGIGMVIAFAAAIVAYKLRLVRDAVLAVRGLPLHDPEPGVVRALVQVTGINRFTAEIGLVSYTLLILFRNTLTGLRGVPPDAIEAAQAMGLTRAPDACAGSRCRWPCRRSWPGCGSRP